jgi:tetratricopeptide (TPR) repeat protein
VYGQESLEDIAVEAYNMKDYAKSFYYFKQAWENNVSNQDYAYYTIWCANAIENYTQATIVAESFLKNNWVEKIAIEYAYTLRKTNRPSEAVAIYQQLLAQNRNHPYVNYQLGLNWKEMKDNHKALGQFKYCIEHNLYLPESYYEAGRIYNENYDLENAKFYLKEAINNKKAYADAYFELGTAFFKSDNTYLALDNIYMATQLDIHNPEYPAKIGDMYFSNLTIQSYEKSLHYYLTSIENNTKDPGVYFKVGWIYNHKKDFANAIKYLETAITLQSDKKDFFVELGYAYYYNQSYEKAIEVLEKARLIDAKDDYLLFLLAKCYREFDDDTEFNKQKALLKQLHSKYLDKL